jgi:endonuclease/exonuclease/phosphatase (EEP) superfamily protein YafD
MITRPQTLTPDQLAWCQQRMPGFAAAYADVCRRDADVAANRAAFQAGVRQQSAPQRLTLVPDAPRTASAS